MLFSGKNVLVTGSSRGIGAATAKLFAEHGANVAINYYSNESAANSVLNEIIEKGGKAEKYKADVTDSEQVNKMIDSITSSMGEIDVLILNAGLNVKMTSFIDSNWDDLEYKVNGELKGLYYCCKSVVPQMIKRKDGCIISVSSGLSRRPNTGFAAHSASKAAVDAYVRSLAFELGQHGIRVNTIAPGLTVTDATSFFSEEQKQMAASFLPLKKLATPEDVAGAILMLASNYSKYVTGVYVPVSGGGLMI